jgi:predicted DNA-binding transcriptional regulator AlpA
MRLILPGVKSPATMTRVTNHLVGAAEVASMLGVSRQRVSQIAHAYPDFPPPEAVLSTGRVWSRRAIQNWMAAHPERRPGRRRE